MPRTNTPPPSDVLAAPKKRRFKAKPVAATDFSAADRKRFWSKVQKGKKGECWKWIGTHSKESPIFFLCPITHQAIRVSLALSGVKVLANQKLRRNCDCKSCINPRHISVYDQTSAGQLLTWQKWITENAQRVAGYGAKWRANNGPKVREFNRRADKKRTKDRSLKRKIRYHSDPLFRLKVLYRSRHRVVFSTYRTKIKSSLKILGCTLEQLKVHLESQFQPGMTWANHGKWHIDHKIPICRAKNITQVKKLSHYTNLQPLWAMDNFIKGGRCVG